MVTNDIITSPIQESNKLQTFIDTGSSHGNLNYKQFILSPLKKWMKSEIKTSGNNSINWEWKNKIKEN